MLVLLAGLVPPALVAAADLTFTPAADAHVNSGNPSGNYGGLTTMKVREGSGSAADPAYRGYWRFTVTGLTGGAASVKLRLFVTDASSNSQGVYPIANTSWTETGLTYGNAPPIAGSPLASRTAPTANAYLEFALPSTAVPGNGPVAFAIKSAGTDSAIFATREVSANPPQLVVTPSTGPPPPVSEFSGSPTSGPVGQSVSFDSSGSQGSGLTYAWSFGDGTTPPEANQANPVHQYASAGTYTVALTVSNVDGTNTRTRPGYITIGNPPVANFTATPSGGTAPLLVAFNGTSSSGANLTYAWDFGDPASGAANTSTLPQPSHTYAAGSYQVRLTVSNVNGTSTSPPTAIAVTPPAGGSPIVVAPAADAQVYGSSPNTNYGSLTTIRTREDSGASGTYRSYLKFNVAGTGGSVTALKLRLFVTDATPNLQGVYAVSNTTWTESGLRWSNAPPIVGSPLVSGPAPNANAYVEFALPATAVPGDGLYTFAIKSSATNSAIFRSKEATTNRPQLVVTLGAPPPIGVPTAAFTSDRTSGQAPLAVQFTDQSTNGPNAWSWDFGEPSSGSANVSTLRNPSHLFSTEGSHTVTLIASNGNGASEPATGTITVDPAPPGDPVLVGAGDIADCTVPQDEATATLLDGIAGTVFTAGDNAYPNGATADFDNCYAPTWGRHKARTMPTPGNHEYLTTGAAGHFSYFGAAAGDPTKGYYSFDIGSWHAVMLNSNCAVVSCALGSAQETWLRADLAAHPTTCTIAIWHHPRFSSGDHGDDTSVQAFWDALYAGGADIVVNGHDHDYERFAPQTPAGAADPDFGIREFVAGTGGRSLRPFITTAANSEVRDASTWGVLKLTLHPSSYDYSFIPIAGQTFTDAGSGSCHGVP